MTPEEKLEFCRQRFGGYFDSLSKFGEIVLTSIMNEMKQHNVEPAIIFSALLEVSRSRDLGAGVYSDLCAMVSSKTTKETVN